jgi:hypothetical protein
MNKVQIKVLLHWKWDENKPNWHTNHGSYAHTPPLHPHF